MRRTARYGIRLAAALALAAIGTVYGERPAAAESTVAAIERIRSGGHAEMPPPQTTAARGPVGDGMTIENGTGHVLRIHFSGPVTTSVEVSDGSSAGVPLAVGAYEVAAEVPGTSILPFYGRQDYRPNTHYWLEFFVRSAIR